ncbi:MAG: DUF4347 domain-containing protein, partial [Magnetococcales bacterium]|nr:DUF4347 domain-containing protein [Magnetococcales bacterium]
MAEQTTNRWWQACRSLWQRWRSATRHAPVTLQQRHAEGVEFWALEARMMFDGSNLLENHPWAAAEHAVSERVVSPPVPVSVPLEEPARQRREIVFVDSGVEHVETLLQTVKPGEQVVLLQAGQDGVAQIAQFLSSAQAQGAAPYDAIHIVSHGSAGQLLLGQAVLSDGSLPHYAEALRQWGAALRAEGDLLFYGCQVAAGEEGALFIHKVADLTAADVAASSDLTGANVKGGNWNLEVDSGQIESSVAFDLSVAESYQHVLATLTVTTLTDESYAGTESVASPDGTGLSLREAIGLAASAGYSGADTITFSVTGTINLGSALPTITDSLTINGDTNSDHVADVTLNGNNSFQIININIASGKSVTLNGLTIQHGKNTSDGAGIYNQGAGTTTISYSTITANDSQTGMGGGIYNKGTMVISDSYITSNLASGNSGDAAGIMNDTGGTLTITDSHITNNIASNNAGGLRNKGTLSITGSDISDNTAGNSNTNSAGGGLYVDGGSTTISNSTILNNVIVNTSSASGAGISNTSTGTVTLVSTIIAGNTIGTSTPTANDLGGTGGGITYSGTGNYIGTSSFSSGTPSGTATTITISSGNFTPMVSASSPTFTLIEDGGTANGTTGTSSSSTTLTLVDVDGTATYDTSWLTTNGWSTANAGVTYSHSGSYGTATLTVASNTVNYALSNSNSATEALYAAQSVNDSFTIRVTDGALTNSVTFSFSITGRNDAPVISSDGGGASASISVAEQTTAVTTVAASDVDAATTLTYSISGGSDAAKFTINASSGVLSFVSAPNHASPSDSDSNNIYLVNVSVSDGSLTDSQSLAVTVYAVNTAPSITSSTSATVAENAAVNTVLYTATASDPDVGDTLSYSLSGADAGYFSINSSSGAVQLLASANYESKASYSFNVLVSDAGGLSASQGVTLTVSDVNEAPLITSAATGSVSENAATSTVVYT